MRNCKLEDLLEQAGWSTVYEKHQYKIWITGIMDHQDEDLMHAFLDSYSPEDSEKICFDELAFHYQIFKNIYEKNSLNLFSWN
ncbi:hypothetical protein J7E71_13985 [Mesobacillus foraminis]|uniref:hypothetical protein n=1 Tax=Mesobacillus foraminis TaxID=279826 RepID=UPI001BE51FC2|nr:hypothetical protein [Mesobacillus foraminis]MBT2757053.1 hypothetical protein [Mesobacillus foraminis]